MIRLLLDHNQQNRALSELLVLDADLPDTVASHSQIAAYFSKQVMLSVHWMILTRRFDSTPQHGSASGAGEAAFQLGDYEKARRYLEDFSREGQKSPQILHLLSIVRTASSDDPLASHLTMQERRQRLLSDFDPLSSATRPMSWPFVRRQRPGGPQGRGHEHPSETQAHEASL